MRITLEPVLVTSQKRKEDIKKLPLSVSAISGDTLAEDHVTLCRFRRKIRRVAT